MSEPTDCIVCGTELDTAGKCFVCPAYTEPIYPAPPAPKRFVSGEQVMRHYGAVDPPPAPGGVEEELREEDGKFLDAHGEAILDFGAAIAGDGSVATTAIAVKRTQAAILDRFATLRAALATAQRERAIADDDAQTWRKWADALQVGVDRLNAAALLTAQAQRDADVRLLRDDSGTPHGIMAAAWLRNQPLTPTAPTGGVTP